MTITDYPIKVGRCLSAEGHAWRRPWPEFAECTRCHAQIIITNRQDGSGGTVTTISPAVA